MYLVGTKEQREAFEAEHQIPYFRFQDMTDEDTCMMYNEEDDAMPGATLIANLLGERPLYTVQLHDEDGLLDAEADFDDYDEALEVYSGERKPSYLVVMDYGRDRPHGSNGIYAEEFGDLDEAIGAYEALDLQAEAGIWSVYKELTMWLGDVEARTIREKRIAADHERTE